MRDSAPIKVERFRHELLVNDAMSPRRMQAHVLHFTGMLCYAHGLRLRCEGKMAVGKTRCARRQFKMRIKVGIKL